MYIVTSRLESFVLNLDERNGVTGIRLLDVDYCPRLRRAFRAIMLGVNADAQRASTYDRTAFDEQGNCAVHIEDIIYGSTDLFCTC